MATQPDHRHVAGLILAAGSSSRLGRPKQLLDIHGEPLIHRVARIATGSCLDQISVVVGHRSKDVRAALGRLPVRVVENNRYADGQSTSFIAGINALSSRTEAIVVLLGDQPAVDADVIDQVINTWAETNASIVQARYRGTRSHPVLFDRSLFTELTAVTGDTGASGVIRSHQNEIVPVDVDEDVPLDIDTEDDYLEILATLA